MTDATIDTDASEAFAERLFQAALGTVDMFTTYIGGSLGYYKALCDGPLSADALASRTDTDARYAREWLEQQAVTGILVVDDLSAAPETRRYSLPPEHAEVLTRPESLSAMAWLPRLLVASGQALPKIIEAFRSGGGVGWADYGQDMIEGQGDQNRPVFEHLLTNKWLPSLPDVHERLRSPGARIADVCCGVGWSTIALAQGYPAAKVDGFDLDRSSIEMAQSLAREAGVSDRASFEVRDAADPALRDTYDAVFAFESIHDLSQPVDVLRAMREMVKPDGAVIVMDERVAESFTAPGDDVERLMYGYSVLVCLPAGRADEPSAATGTVMRPETMRAYAIEAGFIDVDVLDIDHPFFRFYRLRTPKS